MLDISLMSHSLPIDFAQCTPVNDLWPNFVERLGSTRAQYAVKQAIDLQLMHGNSLTLPVLISETCGIALVRIESLFLQTGLSCHEEGMVLMLSLRAKSLQLLKET